MITKDLSFQDKLSLSCTLAATAQHQETRRRDAGWKAKYLTFQSVPSIARLTREEHGWPIIWFCLLIPSHGRQRAGGVSGTRHRISALRMKYSAGSQSKLLLRDRLAAFSSMIHEADRHIFKLYVQLFIRFRLSPSSSFVLEKAENIVFPRAHHVSKNTCFIEFKTGMSACVFTFHACSWAFSMTTH